MTTVALAAGGTGGHVLPALSVAEALEGRADLVFLGGDRFEATAVPAAGLDLVQAPVQGLQRSLTPRNLAIPLSVWRAAGIFGDAMTARGVGALLATGGYVAVPAGIAARRLGLPIFLHEQNAHAGLANRFMGRWAKATFTSFPETEGAIRPRYVGNPIRAAIATLDRAALRPAALERYGLARGRVTVGIVGGSLGARSINEAMLDAAPLLGDAQVLHLTGPRFADEVRPRTAGLGVPWSVVGFEDEMEWFFAAVDLVVSRASGMVAELTATGTPSVLIPGSFGSKGHQAASAAHLAAAGAAVVVGEENLDRLGSEVARLVGDPNARAAMSDAARAIGRPNAATVIAEEVLRAAG
ncbi:MAG: UDP-N-acetylglucosamine--N-acetylmuramyl-(pentapeptide) pyrophosphoryl-undecaprenol N-acetylglucosamine transferase [Acidimicrobiia bacterium]|nr:MAG: UDP-N-acetylglucosamine--N-acetylmuramyl-(pentapeptide) pyrophosphoryl-undecaprenol N-acetylglucosamine transferase [Acidimicrobiia bacterium]